VDAVFTEIVGMSRDKGVKIIDGNPFALQIRNNNVVVKSDFTVPFILRDAVNGIGVISVSVSRRCRGCKNKAIGIGSKLTVIPSADIEIMLSGNKRFPVVHGTVVIPETCVPMNKAQVLQFQRKLHLIAEKPESVCGIVGVARITNDLTYVGEKLFYSFLIGKMNLVAHQQYFFHAVKSPF
jgi:hypothetical protein